VEAVPLFVTRGCSGHPANERRKQSRAPLRRPGFSVTARTFTRAVVSVSSLNAIYAASPASLRPFRSSGRPGSQGCSCAERWKQPRSEPAADVRRAALPGFEHGALMKRAGRTRNDTGHGQVALVNLRFHRIQVCDRSRARSLCRRTGNAIPATAAGTVRLSERTAALGRHFVHARLDVRAILARR
jgi:hypothetical protein